MTINCYDYPQYWDLAFEDETLEEAEFIEAVAKQYCDFPVSRMLEPGCGGGRLVVEMARRGFAVEGFDLSENAIHFLKNRLESESLDAKVYVQDMKQFSIEKPVHLAFSTMNTFRHLLTEQDARSHLNSIADSLVTGGVYVLGFHLLPPDADLEDEESWTVEIDDVKVDMSLEVMEADRETRVEVIRFELDVDDHGEKQRLSSEYPLRMYMADQLADLLASVPRLSLVGVYDFCYEIDEPLELSDELGDTVLILRKES